MKFEPKTIELFATDELQIIGSGLSSRDRVWLGERWMPKAAYSDGLLRVELLPLRETGGLSIEVVTDAGLLRAANELEVRRPQPSVEPATAGAPVTVTGRGPPGWAVALWSAPQLRDAPELTEYGPFSLVDNTPAGPLDLTKCRRGSVGDDGRWRIELDSRILEVNHWHQALCFDPVMQTDRVMSDVVSTRR